MSIDDGLRKILTAIGTYRAIKQLLLRQNFIESFIWKHQLRNISQIRTYDEMKSASRVCTVVIFFLSDILEMKLCNDKIWCYINSKECSSMLIFFLYISLKKIKLSLVAMSKLQDMTRTIKTWSMSTSHDLLIQLLPSYIAKRFSV